MVVAFTCIVGLAACGTTPAPASSDSSAPKELVKLKMGSLPLATEAPLYVGIDQGFFKEEGLELEISSGQGGAALVPSVVSGGLDFGTSAPTSLISAAAQGLPIVMIAQGARGGTADNNDFSALGVKADGPIKTPKDLEGKTIAVNSLKGLGELVIKATLDNKNVDSSKIKFVELPFPSMNAAVMAGQVDAAWTNEPYLTDALENGERMVTYVYSGTAPELTVGMYFTTKQYAEKNPDIVKRFRKAIEKSVDYSGKNPDVVRKAIAKYTTIDAATLSKIRLPIWKSNVDEANLQTTADLMLKYGILDKAFKVAPMMLLK